jgi:hypothetical protein
MNLALSFLLSMALGVVVVRLLVPPFQARPAWGGPLLTLSLGTGLGLGLSSVIYFLLTVTGFGRAPHILAVEGVLTAAGAVALARIGAKQDLAQDDPPPFNWTWLLAFAGGLSFAFFLSAFFEAVRLNPQGEWDAWSIWNLRAKFLAGGAETWRNAISPLLDKTHPGDPLLLSALVARGWELNGEVGNAAPAGLSLVFALAASGVLLSTLALLRSRSAAWLAFLTLMCSSAYLGQSPGQYADLPLSFYIVSALACLAAAQGGSSTPARWYALAGAMGAFAAWTKNEGVLFFVVLAAAAFWMAGRKAIVPLAAGAAPVVALVAVFKLVLVQKAEPLFGQGLAAAGERLLHFERWWQVLLAFLGGIYNLGWPLSHPLLIIGAAVFFLKWRGKEERTVLLRGIGLPLAALAAGYFIVFIVTPDDLTWRLNTALDRLLAQIWPAALLALFLLLRRMEDLGEVEVLRPARGEKEKGRKGKG